MIHEGQRIKREIEQLERQLETPIDSKRRIQIQQAIVHLKRKEQDWRRPRA